MPARRRRGRGASAHERGPADCGHRWQKANPLPGGCLAGSSRRHAADGDEGLPVERAEWPLRSKNAEQRREHPLERTLTPLGVRAIGSDIQRVIAHPARQQCDGGAYLVAAQVSDVDHNGSLAYRGLRITIGIFRRLALR